MSAYEFTVDWFTPRVPAWQRLLAAYVGKPRLRFLEIGSYEGRSALWLLENVLTEPTAGLSCIDTWSSGETERRFDRNLAASGHSDQLRKIKAPSWQALPHLAAASLDFAYIDGSHEAADVLEDGLMVLRRMKPGGIILFDDYQWNPPESKRRHPPGPAIDAFLSLNDWRLEELHRGWQIAVRVKA